MATDGRTISINIRAVTGELTNGLNTAKGAVKSWSSDTQSSIGQVEQATERVARLWRAAFEAFLADQVVNSLKNIALGADRASTQLEVAARVAQNFGNKLDPAKMEAWLRAFAMSSKGGGFPIDEMRKAVELFASLGEGPAQIQRAIADTAELAAAKELDFGEAANIVRMALTGHVEMLTRYGVISREAAKNIHTVEEAMRALERGTAGAAEARANKLVGDFGRLSTAASLLADKLGGALAPVFSDIATALTRLVQILDEVPAPVLKGVASFVAIGGSLVTTVLILPAVAKGFAIVREGLLLVNALLSPAIMLVGRLATTLGLGTTGFEAFTAAEIAGLGPIAAVIAGLAGVAVAVVEITKHTDHVKSAWRDWTQYLSDSFSEFVNNFQRDSSVLTRTIEAIGREIKDTMTFQWGKLPADDRAVGMAQAPRATMKDWSRLSGDERAIGGDITGNWQKIGTTVLDLFKNIFKTSLGKTPKTPRDLFSGVVPDAHGAKDGSPSAASDG